MREILNVDQRYFDAAEKIIAEITVRGFSTDNPHGADLLQECIAQIIKEEIEGNSDRSIKEIWDSLGNDSDLENQL